MPLGGVTDSEIDTSGDESKVPKAVRKARQALEKQNVDVSCLQVSDLAKLDKGGICLRMLCHDVMLSGCSPDRLACFSAGGHSQSTGFVCKCVCVAVNLLSARSVHCDVCRFCLGGEIT